MIKCNISGSLTVISMKRQLYPSAIIYRKGELDKNEYEMADSRSSDVVRQGSDKKTVLLRCQQHRGCIKSRG